MRTPSARDAALSTLSIVLATLSLPGCGPDARQLESRRIRLAGPECPQPTSALPGRLPDGRSLDPTGFLGFHAWFETEARDCNVSSFSAGVTVTHDSLPPSFVRIVAGFPAARRIQPTPISPPVWIEHQSYPLQTAAGKSLEPHTLGSVEIGRGLFARTLVDNVLYQLDCEIRAPKKSLALDSYNVGDISGYCYIHTTTSGLGVRMTTSVSNLPRVDEVIRKTLQTIQQSVN